MKCFAFFFAILVCALSPVSHGAIKRAAGDVLRESQEAIEKKDFDKALELLDKAIAADPKLTPAYVMRGFVHGAKENLDAALKDFSMAIDLNPEDEHILLVRAATYQQKKDYDRAIEDFSEAIRRNPNDSDVICSRGICKSLKGDRDGALEDFNKAVKVNPRSSGAYQLRGAAYSERGDKDKALADFEEAIKITPNDPAIYLTRAQLFLFENEPENAISDYIEVLRLAPDYAGANNDYAWTLATNPKDSVRDGDKAVELAEKACKLTEYKHAGTVDTLAAAYAEKGEWESAVKWQEEAVKLGEKEQPDDVPGMKERLSLFKEKKPFREQPKREMFRKP